MAQYGQAGLDGKIAVVTGAGAGIGLAIAREFAAAGATLVCSDMDGATATAAADAIIASGGKAIGVTADVADLGSVENLVAQTLANFERADIVVNNAGILDGFTPLGEVSDALWDRILAVNLTGSFYVSRAFLPGMLARGSGNFINIASMAGVIAHAGGLAYTVSKHGVIGLTRQVAADYGPRGIRANAICPGAIDTNLTNSFMENAPEVRAIAESVPVGRLGKPEEIASLAAYLASDSSAFVQGAAMLIDGGWTIR